MVPSANIAMNHRTARGTDIGRLPGEGSDVDGRDFKAQHLRVLDSVRQACEAAGGYDARDACNRLGWRAALTPRVRSPVEENFPHREEEKGTQRLQGTSRTQ